ncbi:MAG: sulfatase-like hydrolase/transferase [Bacteroidota bacterium]
MNRIYSLLSALALLALISCNQSPEKDSQKERPNIILIMADDMGYETLQCYGSAEYQTPNLDRLAETGMRFTNAYSTPLSTPSRVKIMTGQYNFRNYFRFGSLRTGEYTFGHLAKDAGYSTLVAGKWQLADRSYYKDPKYDPYHFGFDEYCLWQVYPGDYWRRYKNPVVMKNGRYLKDIYGKYGPDIYTEAITQFIEDHQEEPFFIYYPMALPHKPFLPTPDNEEYDNLSPSDVYGFNDTTYFKDMIAYVDKLTGRIVNKLEETGTRENTLILFTGDNGTDREVRSEMKNGDVIRGGKSLPVETGTLVPLIASWEGKIEEGQVNSNLVGFSDFLPTFADALNTEIPDSVAVDGISFYNQLMGQKGPKREWIYCHYDDGKGSFEGAEYVHNKKWKLYRNGEFYNIDKDSLEKNPIPEEEMTEPMKQEKHELRAILDSLR